MNPQLEAFTLLLQAAAPAFTQPSFAIFTELICAWVLCPARRTVTAMIRIADPHGRRAHDAYHRFLRAGVWSMARPTLEVDQKICGSGFRPRKPPRG